jgi:hypothetical protein
MITCMESHRKKRTGWLVIWALVVPLIVGCTLYRDLKNATRDISAFPERHDKNLRKKVVVAVFTNQSAFKTERFEQLFQRVFLETFTEDCAKSLVLKPGDPEFPSFLSPLTGDTSGRIDGIKLALAGRKMGANLIVTGTVLDISTKEEKRGLWWFRKTHSYIQLQMSVTAYDTETGAKVIDESLTDEIEVDEADLQAVKDGAQIRLEELDEAFHDVAEELGVLTCEAVQEMPWTGFVVSTGEKIRISAGTASGIRPGAVLDVFDTGRVIAGVDNQRFFVPGNKLGQIEVTAVFPDSAEARPISDVGIKPGSSVRPAG